MNNVTINQNGVANLICAKQVAKLLNINVRTVYKFLQNKSGFPQPVLKFPRYTRWNKDEILQWLNHDFYTYEENRV